jgi:DnaJ-class molecular chaperone
MSTAYLNPSSEKRLLGQGLPHVAGGLAGDIVVHFIVTFPDSIPDAIQVPPSDADGTWVWENITAVVVNKPEEEMAHTEQ